MTIKYNKNFILIIFITLIYSFLVGSGFYGYGHDYYEAYYKENINWGGLTDKLGYRISTLTIYNKHIGVYVVSGLLAFSTGKLIEVFLKNKKFYSTIIFILIYIMVLHTWPIIMSTSNAMRQGVTMSLVFLCLVNLLNKKYFLAFFFVFLSVFTHRSGIFYLLVFVNVFILKERLNTFNLTKIRILIFFIYILSLQIFLFYYGRYFFGEDANTRIIRGDFRYQFFIISLIFISIYTLKFKNLISSDLNMFIYLFSFFSIPILFLGLNWQYERLMMMMIIPYVLVLSSIFQRRYYAFLLICLFSLLLILTIYQGMFQSLK